MNNDLISIIVPIYNVERYLKECLETIIGQTYKNIEIILVDDGSSDKCGIICDEYSKKDLRIKVIHKENGGLSDARNVGIDEANGKYITFIDSDDYLNKRYIEKLYNAIIINNVLISQCNISKVDRNGEIIERIGYNNNNFKSGKDLIKDMYKGHLVENVVVWNKMYNINLFKGIRYPVGRIHEDEFITYKILYNLEKIAIISDYLYNYRQNEESIVGKKFNLKRLDSIDAFEERLNFFLNKGEIELYELTMECYLNIIKNNYINTKLYIDNSKKIQKELLKKYKKNYKNIINTKNIKFISKFKLFVFYIAPYIVYMLKGRKIK